MGEQKYDLINAAIVMTNFNKKLYEEVKANINVICASLNYNSTSIGQVLDSFKDDTPKLIQVFGIALENYDFEKAMQAIHKLKSRFGYFSNPVFQKKLKDFEGLLKKGKFDASTADDIKEELSLYASIIIMAISDYQKTSVWNRLNDQVETTYDKTILIAEDDEVNAMVFGTISKELCSTVIIARNGYEAISLSLSSNPSLILMDVHMPFCNGIEAIKELRTKGIKCPIITLSASSRLNEKQYTLEAGANEFLLKPVDRESILKIIQKYLASH